jgi:hypothetical protein
MDLFSLSRRWENGSAGMEIQLRFSCLFGEAEICSVCVFDFWTTFANKPPL